MKSKSSKPKTPSQVHLDVGPGAEAHLEQTLTFETVEALLSYDRDELVVVPDRVGRMMKASFPNHFVKLAPGKAGPK